MKRHNSGTVLQVRKLNGLLLSWAGHFLIFLSLLLLPRFELRPALTPEMLAKFSDAERAARTALEIDTMVAEPLESSSLNNLTLLAKYNGDIRGAEKFSTLAAARSARDGVAQSALIDSQIARGQFSDALIHIDGLLRAQPAQTPQVFSVVLALTKQWPRPKPSPAQPGR